MNYSFLVGRINIKLENLLNFRLNNSKINSCSFNYVPMFSARVAPRNLKRTVSSRSCYMFPSRSCDVSLHSQQVLLFEDFARNERHNSGEKNRYVAPIIRRLSNLRIREFFSG